MLLRWNEQDPVSQKEIDRNNAIYNDYQHNRNPFVDHPEYARMIWDPNWNTVEETPEAIYLFPHPIARGQLLHLSGNTQQFDAVAICDLCGRTIYKATGNAVGDFSITIPTDFRRGCYIVKLMHKGNVVKYEKLLVK